MVNIHQIRSLFYRKYPAHYIRPQTQHVCTNKCCFWKAPLPNEIVYLCTTSMMLHHCGIHCNQYTVQSDSSKRCILTGCETEGPAQVHYHTYSEDIHGNQTENNSITMKDNKGSYRRKQRRSQTFQLGCVRKYHCTLITQLLKDNYTRQKQFLLLLQQHIPTIHNYAQYTITYYRLLATFPPILNITEASPEFMQRLSDYSNKIYRLLKDTIETKHTFTQKMCYIYAATILLLLAQGLTIKSTKVIKSVPIIQKLIYKKQLLLLETYNIQSKEIVFMKRLLIYAFNKLSPLEQQRVIQTVF